MKQRRLLAAASLHSQSTDSEREGLAVTKRGRRVDSAPVRVRSVSPRLHSSRRLRLPVRRDGKIPVDEYLTRLISKELDEEDPWTEDFMYRPQITSGPAGINPSPERRYYQHAARYNGDTSQFHHSHQGLPVSRGREVYY
jgi:hypothetical protein